RHGGRGLYSANFTPFGAAMSAPPLHAALPISFDQPTLAGGVVHQIADLMNIENLTGSSFADWLRGDAGNNRLEGGAGDDILAYKVGCAVVCGGGGIETGKLASAGEAE